MLLIKANTAYPATSGETVQLVIDSIEAEGAGSNARIYVSHTSETASTAATNAFALGEVFASGDGTAGGAFSADCSVPAACNGIAVVTTAVAAAASLIANGIPAGGIDGHTTQRLTKLNPIMNGAVILSEAPSTTATYPYAVGDVVAITDIDTPANTNVAVVTTAVAIGTTLLASGTPVAGVPLATGDRITRIPGGASSSFLPQ